MHIFYWLLHKYLNLLYATLNKIGFVLFCCVFNKFAYHFLRVKCSELLRNMLRNMFVAQHVEPNVAPCEGTFKAKLKTSALLNALHSGSRSDKMTANA